MSPRDSLRILNIGLDRELLNRSHTNESQKRQITYSERLPAALVHLVKAPLNHPSELFALESGDVDIVPIAVRHWYLFPWAAIRAARRLMQSQEFDLIQVQEPFLSGLAGMYLAHWARLPLVAGAFSDLVGNPAWVRESLKNRFANAIGKAVYRYAKAVRADSRLVTQRLNGTGLRNVRYVPFLITNADEFSKPITTSNDLRRTLLNGKEGPLLLAVVRLEKEKNIPLMLAAVERAKKRLPGLVLAIVGDGSLRPVLERQVNASINNVIRWVGWVSNEKLTSYYQVADLLLLSSDVESSARVLTEAQLAGIPVLTTDTAGAREVVDDGKSGTIVPIGDMDSFVSALLELCERPRAERERMGRYAQKRMLSMVSQDAVIEQLRQLYYDVLEHHA